MKFLFVALALLSPLASHAQAILNEPKTPEVGTAVYVSVEPRGDRDGHFMGILNDGHQSDAGAIFCDKQQLKATAWFGNTERFGYFSFESTQKCDEVANAMISNPSTKVAFSVTIDNSMPEPYGSDYLYGHVISVQWLK